MKGSANPFAQLRQRMGQPSAQTSPPRILQNTWKIESRSRQNSPPRYQANLHQQDPVSHIQRSTTKAAGSQPPQPLTFPEDPPNQAADESKQIRSGSDSPISRLMVPTPPLGFSFRQNPDLVGDQQKKQENAAQHKELKKSAPIKQLTAEQIERIMNRLRSKSELVYPDGHVSPLSSSRSGAEPL